MLVRFPMKPAHLFLLYWKRRMGHQAFLLWACLSLPLAEQRASLSDFPPTPLFPFAVPLTLIVEKQTGATLSVYPEAESAWELSKLVEAS